MKDSDWEILHELYQNPNLTRVANKLYITQPSLTKRLQHMEEEFGVTIVTRTPKGLRFTKEGEFLAQQAGEYRKFMENLYLQLDHIRGKNEQEIVIASSYTFSKIRLPDLLMRYNHRHPEVKFTVVTDQSSTLFRKVVDGEVDLGIIRGDYQGPVEQACLGADPGYLVTWEPVDLAQLPDMQFISYKTNDRTLELLDTWWQEQFGTERPAGMNVGYVDVALQLIYKGLGYTLCFLPKDYENSQDLCLTPLQHADGTPVERRTWLVWSPKARPLSTSVQEFIQYVQQDIVNTV